MDAFAYPAQFTYGNAGRNILYGPDLVDFSFSLFKNFPIRERSNFQLRGEIFNLFNHPSFANPAASLVSPDPNVVRSSNFGSITSISNNSSSRQIQLAAKFRF